MMTAVRLPDSILKWMTKICCVFVALFTVGDDRARYMPAAQKNTVLLAVNCRSECPGFVQRRTLQFYRH